MEGNTDLIVPNYEQEVFEGRFQATRDQIINVCDNFIRYRYFDGISFLDIPIQWEENRRVYYGTRKEDDTQFIYTRTLGYVEVTELQRLKPIGVRIRIVCVWPPLLNYWREIPDSLDDIYPRITSVAKIKGESGLEPIDLTHEKPGRTPDPLYDKAYNRLKGGEAYNAVFDWWCKEKHIIKVDKDLRDSFKAAMKRRQNKS